MIYFTSDLHFGHKNIIKFQRPQFRTIEEHDKAIIDAWNHIVMDNDVVYLLGDVGMCGSKHLAACLYQLSGKIHLIRGNHDHGMKGYCRDRFETIQDFLEIKLTGSPRITLCHFPMLVWNESHYGSWHLHGHSHGSCNAPGLRLDVGIDSVGMSPISVDDLHGYMQNKKISYGDYHKERHTPTSNIEQPCEKCGKAMSVKTFAHLGDTKYIEHPGECLGEDNTEPY